MGLCCGALWRDCEGLSSFEKHSRRKKPYLKRETLSLDGIQYHGAPEVFMNTDAIDNDADR